jgi:hypothetical protein
VNTVLIIIGVHAVLLGFALLFAGFMTLVIPSEQETKESQRAYEIERAKSWWRGQVFAFQQAASAKYRWPELMIDHWPQRPQSRKLVYFGVLCLAIAAAVGYHFGVFTSKP